MMEASILPARLHPTERSLRGPIPRDFERFYREHLRFRSGERLRSTVLIERYRAWAVEHEAECISYRELRRLMFNIGHRKLHANGCYYLDIQFSEALPGLPDNLPTSQAQ